MRVPWKSMAATTASSKVKESLGPSSFRFCWRDPRRIWFSTRPETEVIAGAGGAPAEVAGAGRARAPVPMWPFLETLSLLKIRSSGEQFILLAAARAICSFTSWAARRVALPAMKVTRLE